MSTAQAFIKVLNVDCIQGIQQIETGTVKTIVTDPPYFLGMTHNGKKGAFVDLAICQPFYEKLFQEYNRVLTEDGEIYFFCDFRSYAFYYPILSSFIPVKNMLVWDKESGAGSHYSFSHELMIYGAKKNIIKHGRNIWKVKSFASGAKKTDGAKVHSAQKPLALIERIVRESSKEGDLILDTFAGSGTTAIACKKLKRSCIAFELDSKNFEVLKKIKK